MTGDRFHRRNPLIDDVVDVDAAVKPAPAADEIPSEPLDPVASDAATEHAGALDEEAEDDDGFEEEVDGRFGRRNPLVDRTLPPRND
jgi:hypothetical protein